MESNSKLLKQNFELRHRVEDLEYQNAKLSKQLYQAITKATSLENVHKRYVEKEQERVAKLVAQGIEEASQKIRKEYETIINKLNNRIEELEKKLNTNSANSNLPTSKNRIGVTIPNNRKSSGKSIGGQKGHKAHKLESFKEEEITETVEHTLDKCVECGGELKEENIVISDIIDFKVQVFRTRNKIHNYKCLKCGKTISANKDLPRGVSYGSNVNALALSLMNESNVAINKVRKHIKGITNEEIDLSEGYLVKLQKRAAEQLDNFNEELKKEMLKLKIIHWDDTVVKLLNGEENKESKIKNGIIRFYGDKRLALLIGHNSKSKEGIDADNILNNLSKETVCVHDHVLVNYNSEYVFQNAECNVHILRYLEGVKENIHTHKWQDKMATLLTKINGERQSLIKAQISSFTEDRIREIYEEYKKIIELGYEENKNLVDYHFYKEEELKLIKRLDKYIDNHLLFLKDFEIPFSNNTAELGLRQIKRKLVVSLMFKNNTTMNNYAKIISYLETCYRNGKNKMEAAKRLMEGNPYTISELLTSKNNEN